MTSSRKSWKVKISKTAGKQLKALPGKQKSSVLKKIDELAINPFLGDVKPLHGKAKGRLRKRIGQLRIVFSLNRDEKTVEISAILKRSNRTYP